MAPALVGSAGTVVSGSGTLSPLFAQATTAGNLLVAFCANGGSNFTTSATGWVNSGSHSTADMWYRPNCGAGETAPTFTHSVVVGSICLMEFSGVATASPLDRHGQGPGLATSPQVTTMPGADAAAGELVCSADAVTLTKAATHASSDTFNNGATPTTNLNNDASSIIGHYRFSWGVTTGNSAADTVSVASDSMNLSTIDNVLNTFKLPVTARVPRNSAINHQNPAVLMEGMEQSKRNHLWLPKRKRLWLPGRPIPAII